MVVLQVNSRLKMECVPYVHQILGLLQGLLNVLHVQLDHKLIFRVHLELVVSVVLLISFQLMKDHVHHVQIILIRLFQELNV